MPASSTYVVRAHNTPAAAANNKIHDDEVARQFGFSGGLVPGVDVYAYLTHLPVQRWGLDWVARGTIDARFAKPVYDGDLATVTATEQRDGSLVLELRDPAGDVCASGSASLPDVAPPSPPLSTWPDVDQADAPPPASPEALVPGTAFGLAPHGFHTDRAGEYLAEVREALALYGDAGVAHPGWLLRDANFVLASNVVLGPWIHVSSVVQHHRLVVDGDRVSARAVVTREWERKGHRFVELDVAHVATAGGVDHVAARVVHTAIHRPRQPD